MTPEIANHESRLRSVYRGERERPGGVPLSMARYHVPASALRLAIIAALRLQPMALRSLARDVRHKDGVVLVALGAMEGEGLVERVVRPRGANWQLVGGVA